MMLSSASHLTAVIFSGLGLATIANGSPISPKCHSFYLDVPIDSVSLDLDIIQVNSNIDAVNFALDLDRWDAPNITSRVLGMTNISETFTIYAELCTPDSTKDKGIIHILTHGALFDHRYFDAEIEPAQYSYVQNAVKAGYTVLNYDRLCNGLSDHPDAYTVGNGLAEVQILRVMTQMLWDGSLNAHLHAGSTLPKTADFQKVVHIGHSFGSEITATMLTNYGNLSSGVILTGLDFAIHPMASTSEHGFVYAAENNPALFGGLPSGYIISSDVSKIQRDFFHRFNETDPSGFTNEALAYGDSVKSPITVAEWLSLEGLLEIGVSQDFHGPLQFFLGEFDALVCAGDCKNNYNLSAIEALYPHATTTEVYLQPGSGHGLTLHRNASAGYAVIFDFLSGHGL